MPRPGKNLLYFCFLTLWIVASSCRQERHKEDVTHQESATVAAKEKLGKLFIIGGGPRPPEMIQELIDLSELGQNDLIAVLPMSSEEPDTAMFYAQKQFVDLGVDPNQIVGFNFQKDVPNKEWVEELKNAKLIYMPGGDQNKFMEIVLESPVYDAMHEAYQQGAVIAGTSAGAAIMSENMITGDEKKHPEYTGDFRTIEADNIEIARGMGFLKDVIIDQHFVLRMRMNRLITVSLENPDHTAIGIDESTALIVEGDSAMVTGLSQVIVLKNSQKNTKRQEGLLGGDQLDLSVKLPGDKFALR